MDRLRINDGFKHEKLIDLPESISLWLKQNPLTKDLYVTSLGYFPQASHHYYARPDGHINAIILFCVNGRGVINLCGIPIKLEKNQLYIIPPNTPHTYEADLIDPWSIYWAHIAGEHLKTYIDLVQPSLSKLQVLPHQHSSLITLFDELIDFLDKGTSPDHLLHSSNLIKTFFTALNHQSHTHGKANGKQQGYVSDAIDYMQHHLKNTTNLHDLSETLNLSESYFMHLFKEKTGYSPMDYYNRLKIQKVCQQLITTDATIKEIAADFGYSDPYYFSRLFKNIMGRSPRNYRNSP